MGASVGHDPARPAAFGGLLHHHRRRAGLTQEELAERASLSARSVGNLERGVPHTPRHDTVNLLADALRLPPADRAAFIAAARGQAARLLPAPPLPLLPTPLIGREREMADVRARLHRAARLLTLTGPAGVGKTRLALEMAATLPTGFVDGVVFIPLAPVGDPALVAATIAATLGLKEHRDRSMAESLTTALQGKRLLLVLDNFEQVVGAATLLVDLLRACRGLHLLVTSRAPLRVRWEQEYPLAPLAVPNSSRLPATTDLGQYGAVTLFVQRARAVVPDFGLSEANAPAVAAICRHLDGLPLAIELAAPWVKILPPAALLERLERRLTLPTGGARDLPARHQTLWDAISWSYDRLPPGEQMLFARLAVFAGGCTLAAAEAVAGDDQPAGDGQTGEGTWSDGGRRSLPTVLSRPAVLDGLAALVDQSLLRSEIGADGTARFGMLETIREYALARLARHDELAALRRRHATYYLSLAEVAGPELTGPGQLVWLKQLDAEHDNMRATLQHALMGGDAGLACRLVGALWRFWLMRGYLSEGQQWLDTTLEQRRGATAAMWAKAYHGAGVLARQQGDLRQAAARYATSLALWRRLGDQRGIAVVLGHAGVLAYDRGDFAAAAALHQESLELRRAIGDGWGVALTLNNLGEVRRQQSDHRWAVLLYEESLALFRSLGDKYGLAMVLMNLGGVMHDEGDAVRALAPLRESLTLWQELEEQVNSAECVESLVGVAAAQGQAVRAARLSGAAAGLRAATGAPLSPADRPRFERHLAAARAQLDESDFAVAVAAGREMTLGRAMDYALECEPPSA